MTYPVQPGVPAAGHIAQGYWHPGPVATCVKCLSHNDRRRRLVKRSRNTR